MDIYTLQAKRRTHRKFTNKEVSYKTLKKIVKYARLTASGMNLQPIKYKIITESEIADKIFPHVRWAGYLKGQYAPTYDERPRAYVLMLCDTDISPNAQHDIGAASHAIQLMAEYEGLGSCWMGAIDRNDILDICEIDKKRYKLDTLLAIGYPKDKPMTIRVTDNNIEYYLNEKNELNVPKRRTKEIILD